MSLLPVITRTFLLVNNCHAFVPAAFRINMFRILVISLSFLSLTGCAGIDGVAPSELSKPVPTTSFILSSNVVGEMTSTNGFGTKSKYSAGLVQGTYFSIASDERGTYYQGPKGCVFNSASAFKNLDGGIWIPRAQSSDKPRFWYYLRRFDFPDHIQPRILDVLLTEIHIGNIKKDQSTKIEPFLLDQIHIHED